MNNYTVDSNLQKLIPYFSLGLIILIVLQISLGASIRLTGSGLSCPDWPLCYGLWIPLKSKLLLISDLNYEYYQVMLEWLHRLNAALLIVPVTLFVCITTILINKTKKIKYIASLTLFVLMMQGLMGGFTVFDKNSPWSVAVHLGLALILLFLVIKIHLFSKNIIFEQINIVQKNNIYIFITTIIFVYFTMLMGAIVSKSGSSLACDLWPLCSSDNMSILQINKLIHIVHRVLALISAFFVLWSCIVLSKLKIKYISSLRFLIIIVLFMQIFMGAMVIFFELNILIAMIHQILAVILFIMLSTIIWISLDINNKFK